MTTETEARKVKCELGICPDHPHTLERVAILEQALKDMKGVNEGIITRLDKIRDATMDEFNNMRKDIQEGILKRYPGNILLIVSLLTGLVGMLGAGLVTLILTHYLP